MKLKKEATGRIYKRLKDNYHYNNYYYCEPSSINKIKKQYGRGVNCSDIDQVEESLKEYRKNYFKKHIMRKMTPDEKEWFDSQPKVDLNSPEHKHLKMVLAKLMSEGWFD